MAELQLSFAFAENPRTRPVLTGAVKAQAIDLYCTRAAMSEIAWRQLGYHEFDVSELSISSLLIARSHGDDNWVALPVFSTRRFFHTRILVRDGAGIDRPEDLAGKRVGVPEYQQTAALWGRGFLQHECGVDPTDIKWFMERLPERSHGGVTGFEVPAGIDLTYIDLSKNVGQMLLDGELDATLLYVQGADLIDRSTAVFDASSGVRPLYSDLRAEGTRYFSKTGIMPMNHTAVVRRELVERHPWVVLNLYEAFVEARSIAADASRREFERIVDPAELTHARARAFAADPFPYGIAANRETVDLALDYSFEQGLTGRRLDIEELFYPPTLAL